MLCSQFNYYTTETHTQNKFLSMFNAFNAALFIFATKCRR